MTSRRQIAANRRNARKSTGPRSIAGKARSSKNALTHGILSRAPIISHVEEPEQWEAHSDAIREALQPANHLEAVIVERIALQAWRLARVARFEVGWLSGLQEKVSDDVKRDRLFSAAGEIEAGRPERVHPIASPEDLEAFVKLDRATWEGISAFVEAIASGDLELSTVEPDAAHWTVIGVAMFVGRGEDHGRVKLRDGRTVDEVCARKDWTGMRAWQVIEVLAEGTDEEPIHLLGKAYQKARETLEAGEVELEKVRADVARRRADHLVPGVHITKQIARYESHLERSLYRSLHELQRLQAARSGGTFPIPVAVDVDVSGGPSRAVAAAVGGGR